MKQFIVDQVIPEMHFFEEDQNDYSHVTTVRLIHRMKSTMTKKVIEPKRSHKKAKDKFAKPCA